MIMDMTPTKKTGDNSPIFTKVCASDTTIFAFFSPIKHPQTCRDSVPHIHRNTSQYHFSDIQEGHEYEQQTFHQYDCERLLPRESERLAQRERKESIQSDTRSLCIRLPRQKSQQDCGNGGRDSCRGKQSRLLHSCCR